MIKRYLLLLTTILLARASLSRAQEFKLPVPAPPPSLQPFVPVGEKPFFWGCTQIIPGTRVWTQWLNGDIWHYNTRQSVGDGAGMTIYAPAGAEKVGWLCSMDTGVQPVKDKDGKVIEDDLKAYKGLCLWFKGDGSDATGVFSTNWDFSDHQVRVPLKETAWHKVFLPWDRWTPKPITDYWYSLTYSIERKDATRPNWFIVDRVHLYQQEKTEEITPTVGADPPGMLPAQAFVSGKPSIARTLAKLKAREKVTIVVAGDSIPACAQLGYVRKDYRKPDSDARKFGYWYVLAQRLKQDYGYPSVGTAFRTYIASEKTWKDDVEKRDQADLNILCVGTGGWETAGGLAHIQQIINEKPDLVLWEYGANDTQNAHMPAYLKNTQAAIDKLKAAGCEVALHTVTPTADPIPRNYYGGKGLMQLVAEDNVEIRKLAAANNCAMADMEQAFTARGILYVGDLYADYIHPNHLGHEMMADVLEALLTDKDVRTWTHGPAAEQARAAMAPTNP
jgi:hypothetical protein